MKKYIKPKTEIETLVGEDDLLALNPHWVETSYGAWWEIDPTIPAGDVDLQTKGKKETWGDLW